MSFTLTAQLKLQNPNNIQQVVNQLRKAVGDVDVKVRINNAGQLTNLNNTLTSVSKNAKQATSSITNFGEQAALAAKRFFAFSVATNGFLKLIGAIQRGVNDAIEFEKEVYKIAQVTGNAVRDLKDLSDEVTKLSTSLGVSSNKILNAAQILAQAGLSAEDTKKALDALAKTELSATFDDIVNTTEGAVAIFAQFGIKADQLEGKLGSINAVAGKFAVESSDLVTAVRRTGGAFQAAGGSLEELIALFTSVRATTRESAESIATGFRTIFTRLQRVRTVNFLSDLGIQLRDMEGQFIGPYEAVRKLSEALNSIPSTDPRFAQIIEELGGFRQVSKVIPLIQKFSEAEKALVVAQQGQSSLARDAAQAQGSLANQLAKVGEQFDALIRKISNNDSFKAMVKIVTELASAFIKVADAAVPLLPLVTLMATRKVGQIAPQFFGGFLAKKGLGFAKGGLVPGSGNSDSVSANLTPGEYVLKKKAVETIGVDRLHAMNSGRKYAKGGRIEDLTDAELDAMHSEIVSAGGGRGVKVSASSRLNARAAAGKYINPLLYQNINPLLSATSPSEIRSLKLKTSSENVQARQDKKAATELQNTNNEAIAVSAGLSKVARTFGAIYLRPRDKKGEYNTSISGVLRTGSGEVPADIPIFYKEATMTSASAKSFEKKFDAMLPDVVSNLAGTISRNFGSKVLKSTPTKLNSIPGKQSVMGWLFEGALASLGAPYLEDADDSRNFDFPGGLGNLSNVFPISEIKGRPVDAKLTQTQDARDSLRNKAKTYLATTYPRIFRFASGGMAEGTDTVPAMVTPGEYIFSKEAAQRIGYHNLDRMNRVQKFNKGGAVRKYATGSTGGVKSNVPFANADPSTKALALATTLQLVSQQLSGFGGEIDKVASLIVGAGTQFAIMRSVIKDMNPQFKFFQKTIDNNAKVIKTNSQAIKDAVKNRKLDAEKRKTQIEDVKSKAGLSTAKTIEHNKNEIAKLQKNREAAISQFKTTDDYKYVSAQSKERNLKEFEANYDKSAQGKKDLASIKSREATINRLSSPAIVERRQQAAVKAAEKRGQIQPLPTTTIKDQFKNEVKEIKKAQAANKRLNASSQKFETGLFAASAVGSVAGSFLQDKGNASIRSGSQSSTLSTAGGALQGAGTGAAIGAAIGSVVPVIGTLAGAITGGLIGAVAGGTTAFLDAEKQIKSVRFDKVMKDFQRDLEDGLSLDELNKFGAEASDRLRTTTGDDYTTSLGQIEQSAVALDSKFKDLLKSFAKGGGDVDQIMGKFNKAVDPKTVFAFKIATSRNAKEFEAYLKKVAEKAKASAEQATKVESAMSKLAQTTIDLNNAMAGLDLTEQRFGESRARVSTITSDKFQMQPSKVEAFVKNPLAFTTGGKIDSDVRPEISQIGKFLPKPFQDKFTAKDGLIDKGAKAISTIRSVVGEVKGSGGTLDNVEEKISAAFKGFPPEITAAITASLKDIKGSEDKQQALNTESAEDLISKLTGSIKGASGIDALARVAQIATQRFNDLVNILSEVNNLQKANRDLTLSGIDVQEQFQNDLANLFPASQPVTNFDKTRVANITDRLNNDPRQLGSDLRKAQASLIEQEKKGPLGDPKKIADAESEMQRFSDGLKYLADYSKRAAGPLREISLIRAKRQEASSSLDKTFGGGAGSVREEYKRRFSGEQILQGKSGTLSPQMITEGIASLEENKLSIIEALGGGKQGETKFNEAIAAARETQGKLREKLFGSIGGITGAAIRNQTADAGKPSLTKEDQQLKTLEKIEDSSQKALEELKKFNQQKIKQLEEEKLNVNIGAQEGVVKTLQSQQETEIAKLNEKKAEQGKALKDRDTLREFAHAANINIVGSQDEEDTAIKQGLERYKGIENYVSNAKLEEEAKVFEAEQRYGEAASNVTDLSHGRSWTGMAGQAFIGSAIRPGLPSNITSPAVSAALGTTGLDLSSPAAFKKFIESRKGGKERYKEFMDTVGENALAGPGVGTDEKAQAQVLSQAYAKFAQDKARKAREEIEARGGKDKFTKEELDKKEKIAKARDEALKVEGGPEETTKKITDIENQIKAQETALKNTEAALKEAQDTLKQLNKTLQNLPNSMPSIPERIDMNAGGQVSVNLNGAEVLGNMEQGLQTMITSLINNALQMFNIKNGNNFSVPDLPTAARGLNAERGTGITGNV